MKTLAALCRHHRRRSYFEDKEGLIGVYNHRDMIQWYQWTVAGYSHCGSTKTPQGATFHHLTA